MIRLRPASNPEQANSFPWVCMICATAWTASSILSRVVGMWSAVGNAAVILGLLVLVLERDQTRVRFQTGWKHLLVGAASGALMIAATYLLYPVVRHLVPAVVPQAVSLYATFGEASGPAASLFLILVVVGEELVWRGAVQEALEARLGRLWGVSLTTLLYGLAVFPAGLMLLVVIAVGCGLYWGLLRTWTGSLTAPLIAHLLWNLVVLVLFPIARSS